MRRIHAIISGRVQGVSYRASTVTQARRLGVVGWVRNRPEGTVELEAEGDDAAIAALLRWCDDGPPAAQVSRIDVEDLALTGADTEFAIRIG
jgi:acylphosphatase